MNRKKKKKSGNPHWKKGMRSPNPTGRPKGIIDKRSRLNSDMLTNAKQILDIVIAQAKDGDLQAAQIVLSRVLPKLSSQAICVQFDLDTNAPLTKQVEQVLDATSSGIISPDTAKDIIELISSLGSIRQLDEIEKRLQQLELKK